MWSEGASISQIRSHRTQHNALILRGKEKKTTTSDRNRDEGAERVKPNLAEARGAGRELSDLHRLVVVGVVLVICVYVMITI